MEYNFKIIKKDSQKVEECMIIFISKHVVN